MSSPAGAFGVTVVIPLFDKARFIRRTLESVLAQTYPPDEVIVVDDGSTDDGPAVVAGLVGVSVESRVRLVRQPNAGPGPARNRGIADAASDWIAFLDGDDVWLPNHLATLADVAAAWPDASLVATRHKRIAATDPLPVEDDSEVAARRLDFFREAQVGEVVQTSAVAVRRAALTGVGGFGAFYPGEDLDLWTRLALDHVLAVSGRTTALYVQQTGGLMDSLGGGNSFKPQHQPVFAALNVALADSRHAPRCRDIRALRDSMLRNSVKQELYCGDAAAARQLIVDCDRLGATVPHSYRVLAMLPRPLLIGAVRMAVRLR